MTEQLYLLKIPQMQMLNKEETADVTTDNRKQKTTEEAAE